MNNRRLSSNHRESNSKYAIDLARAFGGAIIFSFPMMMTMEMWHLGFYMDGYRLALFTVLTLPLLAGISYFAGFEDTYSIKDDILDTFVAYAVGFAASALMLFVFGIIKPGMSADEVIGKIALQALAASVGAMFTESIFSSSNTENIEEKRKRSVKYGGQIFLMAAGAIFLSLSAAPTEETRLIGYQMTNWHAVGLAIITLFIMHGFIYAGKNNGHGKRPSADIPFLSIFLRYTVVGYAVALLISAYILWVFGQIDGTSLEESLKLIMVLGFPAALGASASRLII